MEEELKQLLALLNCANATEAAAVIARFNAFLGDAKVATGKSSVVDTLDAVRASLAFAKAIEAATNKSGDDAVGLVRAAMTSHAELPKAQARVTELEQAAEAHELDALINKAKNDKKCVPAVETAVREAFNKGEITLAGAKAWLENSPAIPALENKAEPPPTNGGATPTNAPALTWNGKGWNDLKPQQRAELCKVDPQLYQAMRTAALG